MFQFQCPNGHLLEGDESQAGQQIQCPVCQMLFIVPQPLAPSAPSSGGVEQEAFPNLTGPPGSRLSAAGPAESAADPMAPVTPGSPGGFSLGGPAAAAPSEPAIYHIPCPNGHELEVPEEMLRQDVICPFCEAQFHLRRKDSVEYKKQQQEEQERKDRKAGKAWLHWSIAIAVVVLLALIGLIVYETTT